MNRATLRTDARLVRQKAAASSPADVTWPSALWTALSSRRCVAGYWPIGSEASPIALLKKIASAHVSVCLPYFVQRGSQMEFREWTPDLALERSPFDFAQPPSSSVAMTPDCLLIPTVAFDRDGNRIGQGAGHYDRYLSRYPASLRIGLAWWQQERIDIIPEPWDIPLHAIATDREWIDCATNKGQNT